MEVFSYLDEDDRRADSHQAVKLDEDVIFVRFTRAVHVHLRDTSDCELLLLEAHGVRIGRISLGKFDDAIRESGREEQNLNLLGHHAVWK